MIERDLISRTGRFRALCAGDDAAPLVLCLHGFPDHAPSLVPLLRRFAAAGYRAVAPWMRGYAPSTRRGPFHIDQLAADAVALADTLSPAHPVKLVGHDWGAVATYVALARQPERFSHGVALAVPHPLAFLRDLRRHPAQLRRSGYMLFFQLRGLSDAILTWRDLALVDRLWRRWSPGYRLPAEARADLHRCLAASLPAPLAYYRALLWPPREAVARLGRPDLRRIRVPTLHLQGADDGCIGPEVGRDASRCFRGPYRREVLDGAGHFLPLEAPDPVADLALAWFEASV